MEAKLRPSLKVQGQPSLPGETHLREDARKIVKGLSSGKCCQIKLPPDT